MILDEAITGSDEAQRRIGTNIALESQDPDISLLIDKPRDIDERVRVVALFNTETARGTVNREQQSECIAATFAGQFGRELRRDDRASIDRLQLCLKYIDAFQKE